MKDGTVFGIFSAGALLFFGLGAAFNEEVLSDRHLEAHRKSAVESGYAQYQLNRLTGKIDFSWIPRPVSDNTGAIMTTMALQTLKDAIVENDKLDRALFKSQHEEIMKYWRDRDNPPPKLPMYSDSTGTNAWPKWGDTGHLNIDGSNSADYWRSTVPPDWIIPHTNSITSLGSTINR